MRSTAGLVSKMSQREDVPWNPYSNTERNHLPSEHDPDITVDTVFQHLDPVSHSEVDVSDIVDLFEQMVSDTPRPVLGANSDGLREWVPRPQFPDR